MCYKNMGASFFRFVTLHAFDSDRRADGQKGLGNTVRCITCSRTVKTVRKSVPWMSTTTAQYTTCSAGVNELHVFQHKVHVCNLILVQKEICWRMFMLERYMMTLDHMGGAMHYCAAVESVLRLSTVQSLIRRSIKSICRTMHILRVGLSKICTVVHKYADGGVVTWSECVHCCEPIRCAHCTGLHMVHPV